MNHMNNNGEITYKILRPLGILKENDKGYTKEVNIMTWNRGKPKFDLREWNPDHDPRKGITLTEEEAIILRDLLISYFDEQEGNA